MIDKNNIWHVAPTDDSEEHLLEVDFPEGLPVCNCKCRPVLEEQEGGGLVVVHNSFDGRELYEPDNDVRKQ